MCPRGIEAWQVFLVAVFLFFLSFGSAISTVAAQSEEIRIVSINPRTLAAGGRQTATIRVELNSEMVAWSGMSEVEYRIRASSGTVKAVEIVQGSGRFEEGAFPA